MPVTSLNTAEDIVSVVESDKWMMSVLLAVKQLELQLQLEGSTMRDFWVCAGFVRSKVWDVLHGFEERTPLPDVDVVFYDPSDLDKSREKELEGRLNGIMPAIPWSVKNQARMHLVNNYEKPYTSTLDAVAKFTESATAVAVALDDKGEKVVLAAPCGVEDLLALVVAPTPFYSESDQRMDIYRSRIAKKKWWERWHLLKLSQK